MVTFIYNADPPSNHLKLEEGIKEKYKDIFDQFPNKETTFTWTGEKWTIASGIEMGYFTLRESGNDNS